MSDTEGNGRRSFIGRVGLGAALLASLGPVGATLSAGPAAAQASMIGDVQILNFLLQLEYLEAEFYLRAISGAGLGAGDINGVGPLRGVNGGSIVPFTTPLIAQVAADFARDEQQHVRFLRSALGGSFAVARPLIDLAGGFQAAALAAGVIQPGQGFSPFADQTSFLLGAFLFEDVGVTAYAGAASMLASKDYLNAVASILAVEGYHGGVVRTLLAQVGGAVPYDTQAIANLRSQATGAVTDVGVVDPASGYADLAPTDGNALAYRRTMAQVANIVTLGNGTSGAGGFFPLGMTAGPDFAHGAGIGR